MKDKRIIAIDPSSKHLAWSVLDSTTDGISIVDYGKIDYGKATDTTARFAIIKSELSELLRKYHPGDGIIEQTVYIQNFQSSRVLSYIVGFTWGVLDDYCKHVEDVNPLVWKPGIGYKNLTKYDKERIKAERDGKNMTKWLKHERKERVRVIIEECFGKDAGDEDINDSLGIGLWYHHHRLGHESGG